MKKINSLIVVLSITLFMLIGMALEQGTWAQTQTLTCDMIKGCTGGSCGVSGTASGCDLTCQDGATVKCPKKGADEND